MRKLLLALCALFFMVGGSASVAMAQADATPAADEPAAGAAGDTAFARGLDAPATYFAENGSPVATVTVSDVERGWQDFGEYYEPDPGVEYVAVTFQVESVSKSNLVVKAYDFSLLDGFGRNNSRSYVDAAEGSDVQLLDDDVAVASGETAEFTVVFELFEDTEIGYFMWQPDSGVIVLVDLSEV
ncbi:MAG TPA: DUF4352 domain-containing protein [Thermomicrobiales bacterium]|nr:DUF4352 domain-containing protein [Thermomicrobiales bacterium]